MKLSLAGAFLLDHSTNANGRRRTNGLHWTWLERAPSLAPRIPRINACVFKLNIMRIFERRPEVFIGARSDRHHRDHGSVVRTRLSLRQSQRT